MSIHFSHSPCPLVLTDPFRGILKPIRTSDLTHRPSLRILKAYHMGTLCEIKVTEHHQMTDFIEIWPEGSPWGPIQGCLILFGPQSNILGVMAVQKLTKFVEISSIYRV